MSSMRDLLEQRGRVVAQMRHLTDHPEGDGGDLSDGQVEAFDKHKTELAKVEAGITRQQLVDDAERRMAAPAIIHGNGRDGQFEERARDFSLIRAINDRLDPGSVDAGFEREISGEVKRRSARTFQGIAVPDQYFEIERRVHLVGAGGSAADLYPTMHRPDLFIDLLRSSLLVGRLGATVLSNLQGDQDIPRQTASGTAEWLAEDAPITPSDATFDDLTLSPKTVGSITSYSRRTLINASPGIEQILRRDLAAVIAAAIDVQALFGTGLNDTPLGVVGQANVHALTLAGPTWAQVIAFPAEIQSADADVGSLGWAMHPKAVAKFRTTLKDSADTSSNFLMAEPGNLAGYPVAVSTAIPIAGSPPSVTSVIFGAWSQLLVGYWSGLDLLANPYESTAYHRGRVLLRAMRDVDVGVRHGESFAVASDLAV